MREGRKRELKFKTFHDNKVQDEYIMSFVLPVVYNMLRKPGACSESRGRSNQYLQSRDPHPPPPERGPRPP